MVWSYLGTVSIHLYGAIKGPFPTISMELSTHCFQPSLWSYLGTVSIHLYGPIKAQSPAIFRHSLQPSLRSYQGTDFNLLLKVGGGWWVTGLGWVVSSGHSMPIQQVKDISMAHWYSCSCVCTRLPDFLIIKLYLHTTQTWRFLGTSVFPWSGSFKSRIIANSSMKISTKEHCIWVSIEISRKCIGSSTLMIAAV